MAGTVEGGKKAAATNKKNGEDFYKKIGAVGGHNGKTGGFGQGEVGRERARLYGTVGGTISRRGPMTPEKREAARERRSQKQFEENSL